MKYREILKLKWPNKAVLRYTDDTYEGIIWNPSDGVTVPTKSELDTAITNYANAVSAGTFSKVVVNDEGRVISGSQLANQDIVNALGFVPAQNAGQINVLAAYTGSTGVMSGTTIIPADNTAPLITEGTQVWSQTLTPNSVVSKFIIDQSFMVTCGTSGRQVTVAVFRGSECVYASSTNIATSRKTAMLMVHLVESPNTTEPITYSLRVGTSASSTWYLNTGASNTINFGGLANSSDWSILEIE